MSCFWFTPVKHPDLLSALMSDSLPALMSGTLPNSIRRLAQPRRRLRCKARLPPSTVLSPLLLPLQRLPREAHHRPSSSSLISAASNQGHCIPLTVPSMAISSFFEPSPSSSHTRPSILGPPPFPARCANDSGIHRRRRRHRRRKSSFKSRSSSTSPSLDRHQPPPPPAASLLVGDIQISLHPFLGPGITTVSPTSMAKVAKIPPPSRPSSSWRRRGVTPATPPSSHLSSLCTLVPPPPYCNGGSP